jgi:hypothetical protein
MPVDTDDQAESLKAGLVQVVPRPLLLVGTNVFAGAPVFRIVVGELLLGPAPYDTFDVCGGNDGANAVVCVPSGLLSARYSPPLASEKFVCG